jgi:hypothetical protein
MISTNNVEDNTSLIRKLKHSKILRDDINALLMLKGKYLEEPEKIQYEAITECNFLFTYYTDIFNKIKNDEINLKTLFDALDVLKNIEDGKIDMHEGAFEFGSLLKKLYVDSALKKAEKINAATGDTELKFKGPQINISWSQFKQMTAEKTKLEEKKVVQTKLKQKKAKKKKTKK